MFHPGEGGGDNDNKTVGTKLYQSIFTSHPSFVAADAQATAEQLAFYGLQILQDLVRVLTRRARTPPPALVRVRGRQFGICNGIAHCDSELHLHGSLGVWDFACRYRKPYEKLTTALEN